MKYFSQAGLQKKLQTNLLQTNLYGGRNDKTNFS